MNTNAYLANVKKEVEGTHKEWVDDLLARLPQKAVVFEIGSATSRDAEYMEKTKPGLTVVCSDKEKDFVEHLEKSGRKTLLFDVIKDEFPAGQKYDAIYAHLVANHFTPEELKRAFGKIRNAVHENGFIAVSFPQGDNGTLAEWNSNPKNTFCRYYSAEEINSLASFLALSFVFARESEDGKILFVTLRA